MKKGRRTFVIGAAGVISILASSRFTFAQGTASLSEADPQAQALGYKADASKVDKAKFPKYGVNQMCSSCQLYQGKPNDAAGPCPLFPNKAVAAKGWCSAWAKKA